jgi:hypothetical protein
MTKGSSLPATYAAASAQAGRQAAADQAPQTTHRSNASAKPTSRIGR